MMCDVLVVDEDYLYKPILRTPGSIISDWGTPRNSVSLDSTVGSGKQEKSFKFQGQERRRVGGRVVDRPFF